MTNEPEVFVNVNGWLGMASEARISPLDHGFLYGDSVYETIRTFHRRPFLLDPHLDRLQRSLEKVFLTLPLERGAFATEVERTIEAAPLQGDVGLRIVVSRGPGPLGLDISKCTQGTYVIYTFAVADRVPPEASPDSDGGGVTVVISKTRRNSPRALDPSIKSGNFLNNILAYKDARDAGAHEALLCTPEGYLAEGTTSNVFLVKGGVLRTPREYGILSGITRAVVIEEASRLGLTIEEASIPPEALFAADEVFITSSIRGIVPVTQVNDRKVKDGRRGAVTQRLQELYERRVEAECGGP